MTETAQYDLSVRQSLGRKTFWIFLINHSILPLFFLALAVVFWIMSAIGANHFLANINVDINAVNALQAFLILGLLICLFIFIFFEAIASIWTWLQYKNYTFILDDHGLEVSRGVINKENISIPYHHIEDVNIDQSLFYQMVGVCRITIMTAAFADKSGDSTAQSEGVLPTIDLEMGKEIQRVILARSNVQEVVNGPVNDLKLS